MVRKYGKFGFLKVLEVTKKGRPHYHVLICGLGRLDYDWVRGLWSKYHIAEWFGGKPVWSPNGCEYVLKYVRKSLVDEVFRAVLFASNRRMFSVSRNLCEFLECGRTRLYVYTIMAYRVLRRAKKVEYEYAGTVNTFAFQVFCRENGIELKDMVVFEASDDMIRDWEEVLQVAGG